MATKSNFNPKQLSFLAVLRVLIGWYFLYEGIVKFLDPNWSSYAYLMNSHGLLKNVWLALAENAALLKAVDFLNTWGLIAIGLGLILGCLSKVASLSGVILVLLYYVSYPPTVASQNFHLTGDHVLWVDKNLIFAVVLMVLYFVPTSQFIGFDRLLFKHKNSING